MVTAHAAVTNPFTSDFWQWLGNGISNETAGSVGFDDYLKSVFSTKDSGCTSSQSKDGYHYWKLVSDLPVSTVTGRFRVKCDWCGMYYSDYSSCDPEREAETAYSDYVNTLPAQGYDSAGTLLWQLNFNDAITLKVYTAYSSKYDLKSKPYKTDFDEISCSGGLLIYDFARQTYRRFDTGIAECTYTVPITGLYVRQSSLRYKFALYDSSLTTLVQTEDYYTANYQTNFVAGKTYSFSISSLSSNNSGGRIVYYSPVYKVYPADQTIVTNNFLISTRVNNFNGDYYDSVTNNYYNNTTIINETTNNYYDMTTNNNYTMSNWSYDYASRTYFITLEDGTTVTVQFGDDCMTITNNNVTNSYQYVIKNTPSTPDTPTTCKHDWQETIDTAPTCLEGGHASYTCSLCGETYEQNLAAKGHSWTVAEHVNTVYNADGTVETQGHTLYECSVCGEQWYTDTGAPPPDVSGSSTIIAWLTNFQTWLDGKFGLFVDKLQVVVDNSTSTVENTVINITQDNDAFNVFYIEDKDGNTQSVTEFAGDLTGASGKLLSLLYRLVFADALGGVDDDLDGFEDFFTSQEPVTDMATQSVDDTANEVMNVWAS